MADRPIIFSAPMVRALLDGRKTQTRRILDNKRAVMRERDDALDCVRFHVGDRLYVREAHALVPASAYRMSEGVEQVIDPSDSDRACIYAEGWDRSKPRWRPSIHMPRWASRLTLTVTDVRVQRLQDISEADAWAEGCKRGDPWDNGLGHFPAEEPSPDGHGWVGWDDAKEWFSDLWDTINGPDAWDASPWVVALTFTVQHENIDKIGGAS